MQLYVISILILVSGSFICLTDIRNRFPWCGALFSLSAAVLVCIASVQGLLGYTQPDLYLLWKLPLAALHLGLDPLTLFFALPVALVCGLAALYSPGYFQNTSHTKGQNRYWFFFNLLFASLLTVIAARNGMLFLIAWEIMSLSSFFLVIHEHEKKEVVKAGWSYLVATHIGTAFLLVLFIILDTRGNMDFSGFIVTQNTAVLAFILGLIGFGTKAGIIPLHTWLPEAHPAAPSPVSAVMSGVMIKMGIYGILRLILFTESLPGWWGWVLLIMGGITGFIGVLYSLVQQDIKKFLAYCSVENIGIILLGTGLGLTGIYYHSPVITILGLGGALLHILNHAVIKCLLFLGAGALLHTTGLKNIEQMGGVLKHMPFTTVFFLIGSLAVCGLPPFNGFISEFLVYLASFTGLTTTSGWIWAVVAIGSLSLIGVLAAYSFTRVFGIAFLGAPRSPQAADAHEVHPSMLFPMLVLAIVCLVSGLAAPFLFNRLLPVISLFTAVPAGNYAIPYTALLQKISLFAAGLMALILIITGIRKLLLRKRSIQAAPTWDCGYHAVNPRMQYTASSFANPLLKTLGTVFGMQTTVKLPAALFPANSSLQTGSSDLFMRYIYRPLYRSIRWISTKLYWLKKGNTHIYVLYIALTIILLLIWKLR